LVTLEVNSEMPCRPLDPSGEFHAHQNADNSTQPETIDD